MTPDDRPGGRSLDRALAPSLERLVAAAADERAGPTASKPLGALPLKLAGPLIVLMLWMAESTASPLVASVIPPPQSVLAALPERLGAGALGLDVAASLGRAVLGIAA